MADYFSDARKHFPFRHQKDLPHSIDDAVKLLRQVPAGEPDFSRAKAWLSYACITAVLDGWSHSNAAAWGNLATMTDDELRRFAETQANDSLNALDKKAYEYDARWARGFVYLNTGRKTDALDDYKLAVAAYRREGEPIDGVGLLAEVADGMVYLNRLSGTYWEDPGARFLIDEALKRFQSKNDPVPSWFHWVDAWVHFAVAARLENDADRKPHLKEARKALKRMKKAEVDGKPKEDEPVDFDAIVLRSVVEELDRKGNGKPHGGRFKEIAKARKNNNVWTVDKELARSPFLHTSGTDGRIYTVFRAALAETLSA